MKFVKKLPDAEELKEEYSLSQKQQNNRQLIISEIQDILAGTSKRRILIVGPCSSDREDAILDYMTRLARLREEVKDVFCIIPRVYTSKPRTSGLGYMGLVHRPDLKSGQDDMYDGVLATRKLHFAIINETGLYGADEMLYPEMHYYITDLLVYSAVGARSVENQQHRLVSSGLDMPVGMKNPTSGDYEVLLNAVKAAQNIHSFIYHGYECRSDGNIFAHAIMRGYVDSLGKSHPNYHYEDLCDFYDMYQKKNLRNPAVIIDCNHGNSRKHYDEQVRVGNEIFLLSKRHSFINKFVKGLMIESYLLDGSQLVGGGVYGKSVTDSCLGWEKTESFIKRMACSYSGLV